MIGCSFVVDREYFGQIGLLDPGMEVYGGENIELGMRVGTALFLFHCWICAADLMCLHLLFKVILIGYMHLFNTLHVSTRFAYRPNAGRRK